MKTFKSTLAGILLPVVIVMMILFACQKDVSNNYVNNSAKNRLSIFLTDGPNDYQQVKVEILGIAIKIDTCRGNGDDDHDSQGNNDDHDSTREKCDIWDTLQIHSGIYDLLTLRNGLDTLLASGFLVKGKVERIKLTLGTNNTVMVDSVVHPLHLINNQNWVYVNIHREHLDSVSSNNLQLFLDFDLARSIRIINGEYWLKPKLKPFGKHSSGEIEGKIRPVHSFGLIKAYNSTDTGFAMPYDEGEFKIRGLKEGVYSLFVDGINGYRDTTINNISVRRGKETDLGRITLTQ